MKEANADIGENTYNNQLNELWDNLKTKVDEKMSESNRILQDEIRRMQNQHRQFYKVTLTKEILDKFEPSKYLKNSKKNQGNEKVEKGNPLLNFGVTVLLYEDQNA